MDIRSSILHRLKMKFFWNLDILANEVLRFEHFSYEYQNAKCHRDARRFLFRLLMYHKTNIPENFVFYEL